MRIMSASHESTHLRIAGMASAPKERRPSMEASAMGPVLSRRDASTRMARGLRVAVMARMVATYSSEKRQAWRRSTR